MALVLLTAPIEGAHLLSSPTFFSTQSGRSQPRGQPGSSSTARIERPQFYRGGSASKESYLAALTFFSAHPSTLSPPSPSEAPRPWLVPAPSRRRDVVAETLRQRASCAPHLF